MENNRQYSQILAAAKEKLAGMEPGEIARSTGFVWDGRGFETETLGTRIQISWPDCAATPRLEMWHHLTILQYMAGAKETPLTGRYGPLRDFREGGLVRGSSFDRENSRLLGAIGRKPPEAIQNAAGALGGTAVPGKADISLRFSFLPKFPIVLNLWLEDEDFPPSGNVLLDAAAEDFLQVEAAGTAAGILLAKLWEALA